MGLAFNQEKNGLVPVQCMGTCIAHIQEAVKVAVLDCGRLSIFSRCSKTSGPHGQDRWSPTTPNGGMHTHDTVPFRMIRQSQVTGAIVGLRTLSKSLGGVTRVVEFRARTMSFLYLENMVALQRFV